MKFLKIIKNKVLTLEADNKGNLHLYLDISFTAHQEIKGYIGTVFSLGQGSIDSSLVKQKINSRSSTEAKLISVDDKISKIV